MASDVKKNEEGGKEREHPRSQHAFSVFLNDRRGENENPGLKGAQGDLKAELAGIPATDPRVLMDWLHSPCGGEAKRH
jgi:hypothetical protein